MEVVYMLAMLFSVLLFAFLVWLGNLLMFVNANSYWLILCFIIAMSFMRFFYHRANCKSLEIRDFVITAMLTICFIIVLDALQHQVRAYEFFYLYLSTFLSLILYADSVRFKSLM